MESKNAIFNVTRFSSISRQRNPQISTEEGVDDDPQVSPLDVDDNQQLHEQENVEFIPKRSK